MTWLLAFVWQKMGAAENSALDLPPAKLPSGVSAKSLLTTAPYNAQNPQTNQVCEGVKAQRVLGQSCEA